MSANEDGSIYKFEEKPKNPTSTLASMGIYIFNKKKLFDYLIADEADPESSNDFGKNIITGMLAKGEKMYAYPFEGYWKDVGTLSSLWEANMDLLGEEPAFDVDDEEWRIRSRTSAEPPQYIGANAEVKNSIITEGCIIDGTVINSVLSNGVVVEAGAVVKDAVILSGAVVKKNVKVEYAIVDEDVVIEEGVSLGVDRNTVKDVTVVGAGCVITKDINVEPGSVYSKK